MNRNIILIIVIAVIILSSIGITFYLLGQEETIPGTTETQTINTGVSAFPSSEKIETAEEKPNAAEINTENNTQNTQTEENISDISNMEIKKAIDTPVAGITFINKNGKEYLRYMEKGTGHIKELSFDETIPTNITNTTITAVYDTFWGKDGENLIFRRLDGQNNNIQTVYGTIENPGATSTSEEANIKKLNGTILPQNISEIAISPDKNKVFYLTEENDNSIGLISDFNKTGPSNKKIQIWKSPAKKWNISWPSNTEITLLTKPGSQINGYLYSINLNKNNNTERILGDIKGLTSITSPKGTKTIYSETTGTGFMTYLLDKEEEGMAIFPVQTTPEKCIFSKNNENIIYCAVPRAIIGGKYPDSWYQGLNSFSDEIWKIDLDVNFSGKIISREKLSSDEIDVINPILSSDENYLGFINKKDGSPWMVKIK